MRTGRIAAVLCLLGANLLASDLPRPVRTWEAIVSDAALLEDLGRMARLGTSRANETEVAAFIVRRDDGRLALDIWPDQWKTHRQSWRGAIPAAAIALVHTHPNHAPVPSPGDCALARSTGLPVIALSRWSIWVIEPDRDEPVPLVSRRNWVGDAGALASK